MSAPRERSPSVESVTFENLQASIRDEHFAPNQPLAISATSTERASLQATAEVASRAGAAFRAFFGQR